MDIQNLRSEVSKALQAKGLSIKEAKYLANVSNIQKIGDKVYLFINDGAEYTFIEKDGSLALVEKGKKEYLQNRRVYLLYEGGAVS